MQSGAVIGGNRRVALGCALLVLGIVPILLIHPQSRVQQAASYIVGMALMGLSFAVNLSVIYAKRRSRERDL